MRLNTTTQILITGAAGSIGKLFVESLLALDSGVEIWGLDNDDTELYKITQNISDTHRFHPVLADISCSQELETLFSGQRFDYIIHTAAHKQVSLLEQFPQRSLNINTLASIQLFEYAKKADTSILFISSDKSVKPFGVLGLTKYLTELISSFYFEQVSVLRLPNIIGSRGSFFSEWFDVYQNKGFIPVTDLFTKRYCISLQVLKSIIVDWYVHLRNMRNHVFIPSSTEEIQVYDFIRENASLKNISASSIRVTGLREGEKVVESLQWPHETFSTLDDCSVLVSPLSFPKPDWIHQNNRDKLSEETIKTVFYNSLKTLNKTHSDG